MLLLLVWHLSFDAEVQSTQYISTASHVHQILISTSSGHPLEPLFHLDDLQISLFPIHYRPSWPRLLLRPSTAFTARLRGAGSSSLPVSPSSLRLPTSACRRSWRVLPSWRLSRRRLRYFRCPHQSWRAWSVDEVILPPATSDLLSSDHQHKQAGGAKESLSLCLHRPVHTALIYSSQAQHRTAPHRIAQYPPALPGAWTTVVDARYMGASAQRHKKLHSAPRNLPTHHHGQVSLPLSIPWKTEPLSLALPLYHSASTPPPPSGVISPVLTVDRWPQC